MAVVVELDVGEPSVRRFELANRWTFDYNSGNFIVLNDRDEAVGEFPRAHVVGVNKE